MKITRISPFSGKKNTMEIDITEEQLVEWQQGELIQDVMPHVPSDEREFIISGITPEEWDELFGAEESDLG